MVKKHITHDDYKNCLLNREEQMRNMNVIRSHLHDVYTEEVNKVALSVEDDNRVIMENGIHTLAYGHYSRKKTEGGSTRGVGGAKVSELSILYLLKLVHVIQVIVKLYTKLTFKSRHCKNTGETRVYILVIVRKKLRSKLTAFVCHACML